MTTNVIVTSQDVQRRLNNVLAFVSNEKKLMGAIAATLHEETNENFATKGHGTWPALKPFPEIRSKGRVVRRARGPGDMPLRDRSNLYNSITERSTNTSAELGAGTNVKYSALHQFGARQGQFGKTKRNTPIPWGDVPARPYFPIDSEGNILPSALERVMEVLDVAVQNALE